MLSRTLVKIWPSSVSMVYEWQTMVAYRDTRVSGRRDVKRRQETVTVGGGGGGKTGYVVGVVSGCRVVSRGVCGSTCLAYAVRRDRLGTLTVSTKGREQRLGGRP